MLLFFLMKVGKDCDEKKYDFLQNFDVPKPSDRVDETFGSVCLR